MISPITNREYSELRLSLFHDNLDLPRHRWFEFKEGFSEKLVRLAVGEVPRSNRKLRILDPFVGVGTTLVAAGRMGFDATGIEVNPFLAFACRAKCSPNGWRHSTFQTRLDSVLSASRYELPSHLEGVSTFTEAPKIHQWLFNRSVLRGFAALSQAIQGAGRYRDPLKLALLAALAECCNARRDGKCLRYRKDWRKLGYTSADLRQEFIKRAMVVFEDVHTDFFRHKGIRAIGGDTRKVLVGLPSDSHDLLVTSPPYLNSFDYSDVYRPELFAGGFVKSNEDLRRVRLEAIRSHVQVKWVAATEVASTLIPPLLSRIKKSILWDKRLPSMVQSYFADLANIVKQCARLVRPGGRAWIVVGTSAYGGVEIPVDLILGDIAAQSGWSVKSINVLRQLRAAGQQWSRIGDGPAPPLRESLVILERG